MPTPRSVLLLTPHRLPGISDGRVEVGEELLVLSGPVGAEVYFDAASAAAFGPSPSIAFVKTAYVYVMKGESEKEVGLLLDGLKRAGKKVCMVACGCCDREKKGRLAAEFGIEWIQSACGGERVCLQIIDHFARGKGGLPSLAEVGAATKEGEAASEEPHAAERSPLFGVC